MPPSKKAILKRTVRDENYQVNWREMFLKVKIFTCNLAYQEILTASFSNACSFVQGMKPMRFDALGNWWKCLSYNGEVILGSQTQQGVSFLEPLSYVTRDILVTRLKIITL